MKEVIRIYLAICTVVMYLVNLGIMFLTEPLELLIANGVVWVGYLVAIGIAMLIIWLCD